VARFKFELETVLELRRNVERTRQLAVAELERERVTIEDRIRALQRQIVAERDDLRLHLDSARDQSSAPDAHASALMTQPLPVDLSAVRMQANASLHLVARAHQEVLRLAGVHQRIDAARLELLKATTDRKAVEVLRQRRYDAWKFEQDRREAAALDEIATVGASRWQEAA
jgi:flagellar export protein FliJ